MDNVQYFILASQTGNIKEVKECIVIGIPIDSQDEEGTTALQAASANGHEDIVKYLLSSGASVDTPNYYGWTPLLHAVKYSHISVVSLLLECKARVNTPNKLGATPLVLAAWNGNLSILKILLEAGAVLDSSPSLNEEYSECDLTPLMASALCGHDHIVRVLLERGIYVSQLSSATKLSPLMMASCNGHKKTVQMLVEWGGDANLINICHKTAWDIAMARGKCEVKAYLDDMTVFNVSEGIESEDVMIISAIKNRDHLGVKRLIEEDASCVNWRNPNDGSTPLIYTAILGHLEIAKLLVENGAELNVQDSVIGWTALMQAVSQKHTSVVRFLVNAGADVTIQANNGWTAVDISCLLDDMDTELINLLTKKNSSEGHQSSSVFSRTFTNIRKCSDNEKSSLKESIQQTGFKSWIAQKLPLLKHSRSPIAETQNLNFSVEGDISDNNDSGHATSRIILSSLRSPQQCQFNSLQKHSFSVIPPLLPVYNSQQVEEIAMPGCKIDSNNKSSPVISIQPINLLKNYRQPKRTQAKKCSPALSLEFLLKNNSLDHHLKIFKNHEVDMEAFLSLTDADLLEMGINNLTDRQKILQLIKTKTDIPIA